MQVANLGKAGNFLRRNYRLILTILVVYIAIDVGFDIPSYAGYKDGLPIVERQELRPASIDASWIISGSPVFHANAFEHLPGTMSGIWECIGPGKFVWHYSVDETIYILEGSATIEYLGNQFTLNRGDSTRFVAGTMATWVVTDRVRKTFRITNLGFVEKIIRTFFRYI
jgi:uncharacterized protein